MKASTRGARGSTRHTRVRTALVAAEVALSALCLATGGLLLHSFVKLLKVDGGFERQQILTVNLQLPSTRYADTERRGIYLRAVLARVAALPGVVSAGVVNRLPLHGEGGNNLVAPEGFTGRVSDRPIADIRQVNSAYFRTLGIPLVSGRVFDESEKDHPVVLVSALTAARLWPGQNPLGRRMAFGDATTFTATVVGIVGDVRGVSLERTPSLTVYVPYWQQFRQDPAFAIRTAGAPAAVAGAVREVLRQVDREIPIPAFQTMEELVAASVARRRFQVRLVLLFGLVAALLASLGIYGVVSYAVAQRTSELGIRMALGAAPSGIRWMVLRQGLAPVAAGLACGLAASLAAGRVVSSQLYGVTATDPPTLAGVVFVLGSVAAAATLSPAHRATRVDPVVALREE